MINKKIIPIVLFLVLISTLSVSAVLPDINKVKFWLEMEEEDELTDETGYYTFNLYGEPQIDEEDGVKDQSREYNGNENDYTNRTLTGLEEWTFTLWVKLDTDAGYNRIIGETSIEASDHIAFYLGTHNTGDKLFAGVNDGSNWAETGTSGTATLVAGGDWAFVVVRYNSTDLCISVNGTVNQYCADATTVGTANPLATNFITNCFYTQSICGGEKHIDILTLWNESLTDAELEGLFNNGEGIEYSDLVSNTPPSTVLIEPVYNYNTNDLTPDFSYNYTDADTDTGTCELFINDSGYGINTSVTSGTIDVLTANTSLSIDGSYLWYVNCSDGTDTNKSEVRLFILDTADPIITWVNPQDDNSTIYSDIINSFITNITITDSNLYSFNATFRYANGSVFQSVGITDLNVSNYEIAENISLSGLPIGTYYVNITVADDHTENLITSYDVLKESSKLTFDTDKQIQIIIESEDSAIADSIKIVDRYNFEFVFDDGLTKDRVFYLKSDSKISPRPDSPYKAHFVIIKDGVGHWVDFEGVKGTPSIKKISDYHYEITFSDVKELVKFNSIGGLNVVSEVVSFDITNYCSEDIVIDEVGVCINDSQNVTYADDNFLSCCYVTGLESDCSILFSPYNETDTQSCNSTSVLTSDFTCSIPALIEFEQRMTFSCVLPDFQEYNCIVNVFENNSRLVQTNPEKMEHNTGLIGSKLQEDREYFTSFGGILNAYFKKDNLLTDTTFRVDTICTNGSIIYTSQTNVNPFYDGLSAVANRTVWLKNNAGYVILGFFFALLLLSFIAYSYNKVRRR